MRQIRIPLSRPMSAGRWCLKRLYLEIVFSLSRKPNPDSGDLELYREDCLPDHACIFCRISDLIIIAENELAFAIRDKFPVRRLHTLIIPKRHVADIFSTDKAEREAIHRLAVECP